MLLVPSQSSTLPAGGDPSFTMLEGQPHVTIHDVDRLPPFLMNVVSNGDVWMFVGSNGGITAGRRDPDHAIFPYVTVDKLLGAPQASGSACLIESEGTLWEPGSVVAQAGGRHLHKHLYGTSVVFEEMHEPLGLQLRWQLATSDRFGVVRRCVLRNLGRRPRSVRILDGWHQMLVPGVAQHTYERYSYLAAAYMRHEVLPRSGLLVSCLNAAISDRPQPAESLRATVAWSIGQRMPRRSASPRCIDRFRAGDAIHGTDYIVRGGFGCYLVEDSGHLEPGDALEWFLVADIGLDHAAVVRLHDRLGAGEGVRGAVMEGIRDEGEGIRRRVAAADGLQVSAKSGVTAHHFSNALFNIMRGGVPAAGHRCPRGDVAAFVSSRNTRAHARHRDWLESLGDMDLEELVAAAATRGDPQLLRIVREYLPICFSRRHGDPSRPWNRFEIVTRGPDGGPILSYAGNWRDIFQNWEALAWSHPACLPAMISAFLNASTADGYNAYRITREGIDWEVADANDPWSHIGYWGDHQIVYLLRLLELHERLHPGGLSRALDVPAYSSAVIPYRIKGFDALLRDPRHSIDFDREEHLRLRQRMAELGGDGAAIADDEGCPQLVSLAEKLLVPALVKVTNLVPGGGIWLNTQRPEWNDANNALAGWGLSVVTTCYLRRHLDLLDRLLASHEGGLVITRRVADLVADVANAFARYPAVDRSALFQALGRAGERHRAAVYSGTGDDRVAVAASAVVDVLRVARRAVEDTIDANRRDDGMYHAYNRLVVRGGTIDVDRLDLMLEGQVAALSSGMLDDAQAIALLDALRRSSLYRPDQRSYLLQPDRELTAFLDRNRLPEDWAARCPTLAARVADGSSRVVCVDGRGDAHFHADLTNEADLAAMLEAEGHPVAERLVVTGIWEEVFQHARFTGRSGTFFAFEGLGSIYWHMVAKLLLAVQECHARAAPAAKPRLKAHYEAIRDGLGFRKTAEEYGAFPTDAYSHTPRHLGAQQPGMTGQVKEEILTRLGELGVAIDAGRLRFSPELLDHAEFGEARPFGMVGVDGMDRTVEVPDGGLAFTVCQVPVIYMAATAATITVEYADGTSETHQGGCLSADVSRHILGRTGRIACIRVGLVGLSAERT